MSKKKLKNPDCTDCGKCCQHIAISIDNPRSREDYDDIVWYLIHENVFVYIDHDNDWYVEFATKCKALGTDMMCRAYQDRPQVCRDYSNETCVVNGEGPAEKIMFRGHEDFLSYLKENRPKPYSWLISKNYPPTEELNKRKAAGNIVLKF